MNRILIPYIFVRPAKCLRLVRTIRPAACSTFAADKLVSMGMIEFYVVLQVLLLVLLDVYCLRDTTIMLVTDGTRCIKVSETTKRAATTATKCVARWGTTTVSVAWAWTARVKLCVREVGILTCMYGLNIIEYLTVRRKMKKMKKKKESGIWLGNLLRNSWDDIGIIVVVVVLVFLKT